ncbi:MAG: hypothetical protein JXA93_11890 [Anaerolineae bacterium]|nr:hypothetical protein [Anaerolineae bacterium]
MTRRSRHPGPPVAGHELRWTRLVQAILALILFGLLTGWWAYLWCSQDPG